jgi:lipoprotein-anchoring transpeptidase ErfK/SrfK
VLQDDLVAAVATLVADKTNAQLRGYDSTGKLVGAYPATIGSDELPSPPYPLHHAIARNAAYYYNPNIHFKQGNNTGNPSGSQ